MVEIGVNCACGKLRAVAEIDGPDMGNRLVCHCRSCQRFAAFLGSDGILDPWGGSDLYQMPMAKFRILEGIENLRSVRLSEKGVYRWFTDCCRTPIANSMTPAMPFLTLFPVSLDVDDLDAVLGPVRGYVFVDHGIGSVPAERHGTGRGALWRSTWKMVVWKLKGWSWPSALFHEGSVPVAVPERVSGN